jgi:SAM-dependent methyltransferase
MRESTGDAARQNEVFYDSFWEDAPDFVRYNPGARHRRRLVLDLAARTRCASVLDVGCGDGTLLRFALRRLPSVESWAGADLSPRQVERNRVRMPDIAFYVLDVGRAALERAFDVVICSEVIEHIEDHASAVRHLAAMVSPGGRLIITCPTGRMYATERNFGHVHHPTASELSSHARAAGLRPISLTNWGWPTYGSLKWATNINAAFSHRHFANGHYSRAAKWISNGLYWVTYLNKGDDPRGCQLIGVFEKMR